MSSNSRAAALAAALFAAATPAFAIEDLSALEVVGLRGQPPDQTRRDRYECHNWAVEQTGATPLPVAAQQAQAQAATDDVKRKRADRALLGAAIGAGIGSLIGHDHYDYDYSAENVIAGAAVGAAIGAVTVRKPREPDSQAEAPSDYLRALTACLEGRGYSAQMPTAAASAPASN